MQLQHYTLAQLKQLSLLAFRKDWEDALSYAGFDDVDYLASRLVELGFIKFLLEYCTDPMDVLMFDQAIMYLIRGFDLQE